MRKLTKDALVADQAAIMQILASIDESDPIGRASFRSRLLAVNTRLGNMESEPDHLASAALLFGGAPVHGSYSIDAAFTSDALRTFQDLISKRVASTELGELGARGPIPLRANASLAVTAMPRGSVGFVLEESSDNGILADSALKVALEQTAQVVASTASSSAEDFEQAVETLDARLLSSLREFFRTLDDGEATLRLVANDREAQLDTEAVRRGRERLELTEIEDFAANIVGELLGLLPDSKRFEMRLGPTGEIIKGSVQSEYVKEYLGLIEKPEQGLVGKNWEAAMKVRVIRGRNKPERRIYTMVGLSHPSDGNNEGAG